MIEMSFMYKLQDAINDHILPQRLRGEILNKAIVKQLLQLVVVKGTGANPVPSCATVRVELCALSGLSRLSSTLS